MRFPVPQFIDVEDKIFGPLTLKQAIYVAGGVGIIFILYTRLGFMVSVIFGLPIGMLTMALAFVKINNRPFVLVVYAAVFYTIKNKLYLWKRSQQKNLAHPTSQDQSPQGTGVSAPKLSQSRLKELAWSLDTHDTLYTNEDQWKQQ